MCITCKHENFAILLVFRLLDSNYSSLHNVNNHKIDLENCQNHSVYNMATLSNNMFIASTY